MADYDFPESLRYTAEDEWVRVEDGRVTVGVSDYAQQQLGDVVFVELPEVGARFAQGAAFGVIESVKAVSDLYAPVTGEVIEVNEALGDQPELVNESCYENGWMLVLAPSDPGEAQGLLDAAAYRKHVEERSED